jgi:hypothetical protein
MTRSLARDIERLARLLLALQEGRDRPVRDLRRELRVLTNPNPMDGEQRSCVSQPALRRSVTLKNVN